MGLTNRGLSIIGTLMLVAVLGLVVWWLARAYTDSPGNNAAEQAPATAAAAAAGQQMEPDSERIDTTPMVDERGIPEQQPLTASADDLDRGDVLYHDLCQSCHGAAAHAGGGIPDLRRMSPETHEAFLAIVLGGISQHDGLADLLSAEDAERIRQYVISRANLDQETSG